MSEKGQKNKQVREDTVPPVGRGALERGIPTARALSRGPREWRWRRRGGREEWSHPSPQGTLRWPDRQRAVGSGQRGGHVGRAVPEKWGE